jgi:hypothetical protein
MQRRLFDATGTDTTYAFDENNKDLSNKTDYLSAKCNFV